MAIQIVELHGCRVFTTASRAESLDFCRQMGGDVVINHREADFVERVKHETGRRGCAVVFDTVGGETFDRSLDCLAPDGRIITCVGTPSDKIPQKLFRLNATLIFEFMGAPGFYGLRRERTTRILLKPSGSEREHSPGAWMLRFLRSFLWFSCGQAQGFGGY